MQVTLGFDATDLQDIRHNLVKLIDATLILDGASKALIRPQDTDLTSISTLFELRRLAMLAWPRLEPETDKTLPEISINGFGKMIEVKNGEPRTQDASMLTFNLVF
ncbi:hypothetical protein HBI56_184570 [Parastagonospora nodorum]|nr:hypothetical protein HBH56_193030 [Parastagonospora nodorum]QRD02971.1 hypothetical protein JI435_142370 [Parastagonospora nodorum SN15]KAH3938020.1 hypothetical protein HBH54_008930 [Parastagonospora nodorum]KAH3938742.1 hypothetical protein HBH53_245450 [Parastagonospora nodorum]KAH3966600.1 hypothetical protein HBH52_197890 [Parastagonospora nodorum]